MYPSVFTKTANRSFFGQDLQDSQDFQMKILLSILFILFTEHKCDCPGVLMDSRAGLLPASFAAWRGLDSKSDLRCWCGRGAPGDEVAELGSSAP